MALPKETQERIKADAKSERIKWDGKIKEGVTEESRHHFLEGIHDGYIAGATAENERAKVIEKTLKLVEYHLLVAINRTNAGHEINYDKLVSYLSEKTTKALQQWNAGKEVSDE